MGQVLAPSPLQGEGWGEVSGRRIPEARSSSGRRCGAESLTFESSAFRFDKQYVSNVEGKRPTGSAASLLAIALLWSQVRILCLPPI